MNKRGRALWALWTAMALLLSFHATYSVRDSQEISAAKGGCSGEWGIIFTDDSFIVPDCYRYERKERFEIIAFAKRRLDELGISCRRSDRDLEGELALHIICYRLDIRPEKAKDADLDYDRDQRWYISAASGVITFLGI
jgi:hypothetical protein